MENTVMLRIHTFFWWYSTFFSLLKIFLFHLWGSIQFETHWTSQIHVPTVGMLKRFNYSIPKNEGSRLNRKEWFLTRRHITEECNRSVTCLKESKFNYLKFGETIISHIFPKLWKPKQFVICPLKKREDNFLPLFLYYSKTWDVFFLWMWHFGKASLVFFALLQSSSTLHYCSCLPSPRRSIVRTARSIHPCQTHHSTLSLLTLLSWPALLCATSKATQCWSWRDKQLTSKHTILLQYLTG